MHPAESRSINMNSLFHTKKGGYTLIETMIAISLFLIVVMYGLGALLNANRLYRKSQDIRSLVDNLSFVVEDMSRNLRTGLNYQCFWAGHSLTPATLGAPRSCPWGHAVAFEPAEGNLNTFSDQWVYYISGDGKIFKSTNGANNFIQMTPDEVSINSISGFSVLGAEAYPGNTQQPLVVITLLGTITSQGVATPFSVQTSVSSRLVDI
jgi:prepilin-type N-terminal cleavage/methylation domain-containing protein